MTQSTLRFLIAGIFTVGLLASLARGDDKPRAPELLPMPHCDACDKAPDCCTAGAPCCQEGSDCCAKSTAKKTGFIVGVTPQVVDFNQNWGSQGAPDTQKRAALAEETKKKQIAELMTDYHALYKQHKYQEAELCAIKAQDLDPDNYVVGAAVSTAHMAKAHAKYSEIAKAKEEMFRTGRSGPEVLAANEYEIHQALIGHCNGFDYRDCPLEQILADLAGLSQINIVPDAQALKDAGIPLSQLITLRLEGTSLGTALSHVLGQARLTYQVRGSELVVTTKERVLTRLERRVFPVPDLVGPDSNNITNFLSMVTENKNESAEATLIQFIQATVEPQSWSKSGGLATIEFFPLGKAMVISQTPETQEKVQKLLNALRLLQSPRVAEAKCDACLVIGCDAPANTSEMQVPSKLETRVYTVADLVCPVPHMACAEEDNAEDLIELIEHFIEPQTWKLNESAKDKPGSIVFYERGKGLIVSQTPEVQERVHGFLESLRSLQGQNAPKVISVNNPKVSDKTVAPSCVVVTAGAGVNQQCERACQVVTEFAAPQLSNHEPAAQALPFITRDANGTTRMGFTSGSFTNEPSPLPPPVPTFKVPQTVDGEKLTHDVTTAAQVIHEGVRKELGTCPPDQACQQPTGGKFQFRIGVCGMDLQPDGLHPTIGDPEYRAYGFCGNGAPTLTPLPQAVCDELMKRTTETLKAITPQCPSTIPPNPTFGQNCQPVQVEATRDRAKSSDKELRFFVPQLGPVPVFLDFGIPRVNGTNSDQTGPNPSVKDYRVSVGGGIRIAIPMLGPVPVALDFGLPIAKRAQSTQACPAATFEYADFPMPSPVYVPRVQNIEKASPTHDAVAVSYAPLTPTPRDNRHSERWTIRSNANGDRPSFWVHSENASMECERLVLKLRETGSLEIIAAKNCVRVRGKYFEAEAEMIECQNNDSKLVLSGNVTLTSAKNDCMVRAKKVVWDSGEWHADGTGSITISPK